MQITCVSFEFLLDNDAFNPFVILFSILRGEIYHSRQERITQSSSLTLVDPIA